MLISLLCSPQHTCTQEWVDKEFYCIPYKDTGTAVIGQTDEIQVGAYYCCCMTIVEEADDMMHRHGLRTATTPLPQSVCAQFDP
jgi:hypothetical protein